MKDYKKILEGVVNIINTTEKSDIGFADICAYIGENCPELKESEDEKVEKAIFAMVYDSDNELWSSYGVSKSDVLAWLEKQGKHANFRNKIQIGDKVTRNDNGELVNLSQLKRVAKQSEPVVRENKGNYGGISPNSEWSEEDERKLAESIALIRNNNTGTFYYEKDELSSFLKSLRDRIQPKQEWSEEDENRFRNLIYLVEHSDEGKGTKEGFVKFINRLKSLKESHTWKPSEEQIEALTSIVNGLANNCGEECAFDLRTLQEELTKLREE